MTIEASMPAQRAARHGRRGPHSRDAFAHDVAGAAIRALYEEVMAEPKPGLVTRFDSGSHRDMDASTILRSLFALRRYFAQITHAGQQDAPFVDLRRLGIAAERTMLAATRGVNTHRGAIFNLGLLAAAAGRLHAQGMPLTVRAMCDTVSQCYGADILASSTDAPPSHGTVVATRYGVGGARAAAAGGYVVLHQTAVPTLEKFIMFGYPRSVCAVQTLFAVMAVLGDTNLFYRGGRDGISYVKRMSRAFLDAGGVGAPDWHQRAMTIHATFIERNLSPGGAADMLAAALFVNHLQAL